MKKILAAILVLALAVLPLAVSADVELENLDIQISMGKAAIAPVIDGKLDVDSYEKINVRAGDLYYYGDMDDYLVGPNGAGLDIGFYLSYDDNNLYVFLDGDASKYYYCDHDDPDDTGNIWNQSCIQISVGTANAEGGDRLEIGLAKNTTSNKIDLSNVWAQSPDGTTEYEMVFGQNCAITFEGGRLKYEVAIPWNTFLPAAPKTGDKIRINWMYGFSDDGSRFGIEFTDGCNRSKDASLYANLTLGSNVLEPPPPPAPEPEPAADVPAAAAEAAPAAVAAAPAPAAVR
ncbi:MAG: hypothetical protein FWD23_18595, partial [Oscillospiraceae bacterium]|nr:hypothetical protein [Oscillospiraceae bacterium]